MNNIVKILALASIFCIVAACQGEPKVPDTPETPETPETPDTPETPPQGFVITASISPLTKASLAEDGTDHTLVGTWAAGDKIFGFTAEGTTVSFDVKSVNATTKVATLEQKTSVELKEGTKVHAIFCPGKTESDLSGQTLALDFTEQSEDVVPVLLLSTATATKDALAFEFKSAVSVIGITNPVLPKATTADKLVRFTVSGHKLVSSGVVSASEDGLIFTGNAPDKFITKTVNATPVVNGDSFTIEDPVYIVVPAGPIANVSAIDTKSNFFVYPVNSADEGPKYFGINGETFPAVTLPVSSGVTVNGITWAKTNLGSLKVTDMGDIFRWSDTGKIYSERDGTTAVIFDENHSEGFNTYEGECYYTATPTPTYTKYTPRDNKLVLEPVDDVVQLTYPGSGWRMPTLADFNALFELDVTYNSGSANTVGTTVTQGENTVFLRGTATVCAPSSKDKKTIGKKGRYWTSSISESNLTEIGGNPDYIQVNTDGTKAAAPTASSAYRHSGYLIRPVKQ